MMENESPHHDNPKLTEKIETIENAHNGASLENAHLEKPEDVPLQVGSRAAARSAGT